MLRKNKAKGTELEEILLQNSYLICCLVSETVQSLATIDRASELANMWSALINQCKSEHNHTLRKVHQQLINKNMSSTENQISY